MLRIVTDGAADMPVHWPKEYQIDVIPLMVRFGEETFLVDESMPPERFYQLVRLKKMIPKTSLPSPGQIADFYRNIARKGDTILSVHLASRMSGTFAAVQMAAREVMDEFRIHTLDSGAGSAALGFMCRQARLMDQAGESAAAIVRALENKTRKLAVAFTLDNLEFAHMSGRISALQNILSSVLRIKPIIILRDGLLQIGDKVRTRQRALDKVVEVVKQKIGSSAVHIAVVHAADPDTAAYLMEKIKAVANFKDLVVTELAIPVAANLGPGTVGIVAYPVEETAGI